MVPWAGEEGYAADRTEVAAGAFAVKGVGAYGAMVVVGESVRPVEGASSTRCY